MSFLSIFWQKSCRFNAKVVPTCWRYLTHNCSVNFKLIHFPLWIIGFNQTSNLDTIMGSGENLPNFSCHFPNCRSIFLQILLHSLVSWKIIPLYFFRSNVIYKKGTNQNRNFENFKCSGQNSSSLAIFETKNQLSVNLVGNPKSKISHLFWLNSFIQIT